MNKSTKHTFFVIQRVHNLTALQLSGAQQLTKQTKPEMLLHFEQRRVLLDKNRYAILQ